MRMHLTSPATTTAALTGWSSKGWESQIPVCLLYTSDAADERSSVDLGGRRIIKKKNRREIGR